MFEILKGLFNGAKATSATSSSTAPKHAVCDQGYVHFVNDLSTMSDGEDAETQSSNVDVQDTAMNVQSNVIELSDSDVDNEKDDEKEVYDQEDSKDDEKESYILEESEEESMKGDDEMEDGEEEDKFNIEAHDGSEDNEASDETNDGLDDDKASSELHEGSADNKDSDEMDDGLEDENYIVSDDGSNDDAHDSVEMEDELEDDNNTESDDGLMVDNFNDSSDSLSADNFNKENLSEVDEGSTEGRDEPKIELSKGCDENKVDHEGLVVGREESIEPGEENTKRAKYKLIPNAHVGMKIALGDLTTYTIEEGDHLLLNTECDNYMAGIPNRLLSVARQLIIDLLCCNTAILSKEEREKVRVEMKINGSSNRYSRSALRKMKSDEKFQLLYAYVQSGKSDEQCRAIILSWFVFGLQPIMHVQNSSGRLVHAPQFEDGFKKFMDHKFDKNQLRCTLGSILKAYTTPEVVTHCKLREKLSKMDRNAFFTVRADVPKGGQPPQISSSSSLVVPILLSNCTSADVLSDHQRRYRKEDVDSIMEKSKKLAPHGYLGYPLMLIFDEDDKNRGSAAAALHENAKDAQREASKHIELKGTKLELRQNMKNVLRREASDDSDSSSSESEDTDAGLGEDAEEQPENSDESEAFQSLRSACAVVLSVTATPIGVLMSSDPFHVMCGVEPYNYRGICNDRLVLKEFEQSPLKVSLDEWECIFPKALRQSLGGEVQSLLVALQNSKIKPTEQCVWRWTLPHMLQKPNCFIKGYRNCLLYKTQIGEIQLALMRFVGVLAGAFQASPRSSCYRSWAVFGIEFHGSSYTTGVINQNNGNPALQNMSLRVWLSKSFFDAHKDELEQKLERICGESLHYQHAVVEVSNQHVAWESESVPGCLGDIVVLAIDKPKAKASKKKCATPQIPPQLKHGYDVVQAIADICSRSEDAAAVGFTVSTPASNGRGVVNKSSSHDMALTDQTLPGKGLDLSTLMQSLRVSGCSKVELASNPYVWATAEGIKRLKLAKGCTKDIIRLKGNINETKESLPNYIKRELGTVNFSRDFPSLNDALENSIKLVHMTKAKRELDGAIGAQRNTSDLFNQVVNNIIEEIRDGGCKKDVRKCLNENPVELSTSENPYEAIRIHFDDGINSKYAPIIRKAAEHLESQWNERRKRSSKISSSQDEPKRKKQK